MPLAATRAPYTLFIVDDDMPLNPREDYDCLGDTGWEISTIFRNPVISCKNCSFRNIPADTDGTIRYLSF